MNLLIALATLLAAVVIAQPALRHARRNSDDIRRLAAALEKSRRDAARAAKEIAALQKQLAAMHAAQRAAATRVAQLEGGLRRLDAAALDMQSKPPAVLPERVLESAIRQVQGGADSAALVAQFGLSPAEAELLARLHARH